MGDSGASSVGANADPVACAAVAAGWTLAQLGHAADLPPAKPGPYLPADVGQLSAYDRNRLALDEIDFALLQVTDKAGSPAEVPLNLTADARAKLDAACGVTKGAGQRAGARAGAGAYGAALEGLHVDLLVTLTAASHAYGKAYQVGRGLAVLCRPQGDGDLAASFAKERCDHLKVWLAELATVLPDHAAGAVSQSLSWWRAQVDPASGEVPARHQADARGRGAERFGLLGTPNPAPAPAGLARALGAQGHLWRQLLVGEKQGPDLLEPNDYLAAGERLAATYGRLARQAWRLWAPWVAGGVVVLAAMIVALVAINGSETARSATGLAALAGLVSAGWKLVRARVGSILSQVDKPLWGNELNLAVAEAVTLPPVGPRAPAGWVLALEDVAAQAWTAASQSDTKP